MGDFRKVRVVQDYNSTLKRNIVVCLQCMTVLESKTVHDFVQCGCPNHTFTDGGLQYQRYGGIDMGHVKVLNFKVD